MTVYHAELYRFGDTLEAVAESEEKAIDLVMWGYREMYHKCNGLPATEADVEEAKDYIELREYELNEVYFLKEKMN